MAEKFIEQHEEENLVTCHGSWDIQHLPGLKHAIAAITRPKNNKIIIDGKNITNMDSAGAWLLSEWEKKLKAEKIQFTLQNFSKKQENLLSLVQKSLTEENKLSVPEEKSVVAKLGEQISKQVSELFFYSNFVGQLTMEGLRIAVQPRKLRFNAFINVLYQTGYQALPIIALLAFMIGVVITYQMGIQLKNYGANIYIVDLLGISILREFGPLLTAIMVAGRTGSSYTAQLGIMKINQEIDALDTMGVTPAELLILPKIAGLFIVLPLLTMWANFFGVLGGMIMANSMLNITWYDFLHRFPQVVHLKPLLMGLGKAPVFALLIASIGCYEGMKVEKNADSLGRNTTRSVVLAIFFIIVADAAFSIIFSKLKL